MKAAAAQFSPVPADVEGNARTVAGLVRSAAGRGARLVVFAELALTGYDLELIAADPGLWLTEDDARLEPVRRACRETGTAAVVNAVVRTDGSRPAITSLVVGPAGTLLTRYDKRHLHGRELELFQAGERDGRFVLDGVGVALAVCYDNRFPELAERAAADGCTVYAASSALERGNDSFTTVYPVRAREFGLQVVLANLVGDWEVGPCPGDSAVWGPDGTLLATAGGSDPGLAVAQVPDPVSR
ncbi:carbon-nitrogen hydrolase family protein [Streptomyces yaizuensis]|uniref:Carbon-nitrogen hydrolase family protein n=1 Tax=Streptomyces yaizuensis TaxID=2989713 RepID=A0ABQ5NU04_9ACTN|nr:carbon-nitrogen hydrolase family protein [Streptomyces sp. YSPA8]GLF93852.1 carbon-nitrogen hydrolase family protein [Streptomyces sp. YSPA8]